MKLSLDGPALTASTRLFGLVGHPVSHSLSPVLQNAAFRAAGIDACYLAFDVAPGRLVEALAGAHALGLGGLNVTVPHKEDALRLAVEADPLASAVGAANTLVPSSSGPGWKAFNTDVMGFLRAVEEELDFLPAGRRCLLLGAGGASRAAAAGLLRAGIQEILVVNRRRDRAEKLVSELAVRLGGKRIAAGDLEDPRVFDLAPQDLLVSATPLGLQAGAVWPWDLARLRPGVLIYDMAYGRRETPLVEAARALGLRAASGRRMLLHQGAAAFSLWTAAPAPVSAMEQALTSFLELGV